MYIIIYEGVMPMSMQLTRLERPTFWRFKYLAKDLGKRDTELLSDLLDIYEESLKPKVNKPRKKSAKTKVNNPKD